MADYTSQYTGAQIDGRLGEAHTHANKSVLDDVTSSKVTEWDGKATQSDITNAINALDASIPSQSGKAIASITQTNGVVSAEFVDLPSPQGGTQWGNITGTLANQTDLQTALSGKATPSDITTALNSLTTSVNASTNTIVTGVSQSNGVVSSVVSSGPDDFTTSSSNPTDNTTLLCGTASNTFNKFTFTRVWNWISGKLTALGLTSANVTIWNAKQDALTPGSHISITSGTISATNIPTKESDLTHDMGYQNSANVSSAITDAIGALDVSDSAVADKYVSSVSEVDGKISVTRENLPSVPTKTSDLTNDSGFMNSQGVSNVVNAKIGLLDYSDSAVANKYVSSVSEVDGVISVTRENLPSSTWGNITGTLSDQNDLYMALATKVSTSDTISTYHGGTGVVASSKDMATNILLSSLAQYDSTTMTIDGDSTLAVKPTSENEQDPIYRQVKIDDVIANVGIQKTLIAGSNITIGADGRTISASGGGGSVDVGNCITINTALPTLTANKTYEIKGDVLLSANVSIPSGVTFFFNGGSLTGSGTIALGNGVVTFCGDVKIASSVQFTGTLANDEVVLEWFQGLVLDPTTNHAINATLIERAISITKAKHRVMFNDIYPINRALSISKNVWLYGFMPQDVYANRYNQATCGVFTTQFTDGITLASGGCVSLTNFAILGWAQLGYSNNNLYNYPQSVTFTSPSYQGEGSVKGYTYSVNVTLTGDGADTCGIRASASNTKIEWIEKSSVNGFVYGISLQSNYLQRITDSQIACCRYGLFCMYTSDFVLNNVHFNTCHNGYSFKTATLDGSSTQTYVLDDAESMADCTCALYLNGCGMVQCNNCRFEFNALSVGVVNYGHGLTFNDCVFDSGTGAFFSIIGKGKIYNDGEPNVDAMTISGCSFMRGCQVGEDGTTDPGNAYFVFKHQGGGATTTNKQEINCSICGNSFSDRCDLPNHNIANHQLNVFYFKCDTIDDAITITFDGNNLKDTASTYLVDGNSSNIGRVQIWASGVKLPTSIGKPSESSPFKYIEDGCLFVTTLPSSANQIADVKYYVAQS